MTTQTTKPTDRIALASKMAGEWWANLLHPSYIHKHRAFATSVAKRCEKWSL